MNKKKEGAHTQAELEVTSLPINGNRAKRFFLVTEGDGDIIARLSNGELKPMPEEEVSANAERLKNAWNNHDKILKVLEDIRRHGLIEKEGYEELVGSLNDIIQELTGK